MKAGIYLGKEQIEIWELPLPEVGGFSEYILIPNAKRNHSLYAVDERISDKLASLIEPFCLRGGQQQATHHRPAPYDLCPAEHHWFRRLYAGGCAGCAENDGKRQVGSGTHHHP